MTIALDIALLPPVEVSDLAIRLNRTLGGGQPGVLTLDETHLPHLTLVQLFVSADRLEEFFRRVDATAASFEPLDLTIRGLDGQGTAMLLFEPNQGLQQLHEALMEAAREFEVEGGADSFLSRLPAEGEASRHGPDEEPARDRDVDWVKNYRGQHALANFVPHVTLGHGKGRGPVEALDFRADRLGVCHLGRHCTCRVILHERRLERQAS